jgi:DNA-binding GntR family transcriptional regulator
LNDLAVQFSTGPTSDIGQPLFSHASTQPKPDNCCALTQPKPHYTLRAKMQADRTPVVTGANAAKSNLIALSGGAVQVRRRAGGHWRQMAQGSTAETIYLEVRFAVLSGQYRPGQRLERDALAQIYECKPRNVVDALNVLLAEGYLDHPKRGMFCVRSWRRDEIDDLIDIRASMMGMAAAKAAERRTEFESYALLALLPANEGFDPLSSAQLENHIVESIVVQAELIRCARVATITDMARSLGPNALLRKTVWEQTRAQNEDARQALEKVVAAVADQKPQHAEKAMIAVVEMARRPLTLWGANNEAVEQRLPAEIARIVCNAELDGRCFGAGGREAGLDGRIIPFGVPQAR